MDRVVIKRVGLSRPAHPVHAANIERNDIAVPGRFMQLQHFMRDAGQTDAGNTRGHAREKLTHQRA